MPSASPPSTGVSSRPLGSVEHAMARTHERFGLMAVLIVRLRNGPDPEALRHALGEAQARSPMLRARVSASGRSGHVDVLDPAKPISMEVSGWTSEADASRKAQEMLNAPCPPDHAPLLRCAYLHGEDRADLVLAFHHTIMDGTSAARLCHTLLASQEETDGAPREPRPLPPPSDVAFPASARGLRQLPGLVGFVGRELAADRRYLRETTSEQRPTLREDSPTWIQSIALTEEETTALVRQSRRERATLSGAVAAAMLLSVVSERYPEGTPLARAVLFSDLRPYLTPQPSPDDLACHVAMQRLTVSLHEIGPLDEPAAVWETARRISGSLHEASRRGEKFLSARMARHIVGHEMKREDRRMGTIALSFAGAIHVQPVYGTTEVLGTHAFIATNRLSPELSAFGHLFRGCLHLDAMFAPEDLSHEDAAALLRHVTRRLTS